MYLYDIHCISLYNLKLNLFHDFSCFITRCYQLFVSLRMMFINDYDKLINTIMHCLIDYGVVNGVVYEMIQSYAFCKILKF